MQGLHILMVAGEPSGDFLGGQLARALKVKAPHLSISGMGGYHMRNAGVDVFINADHLGTIGFIEILKPIKHLLKARQLLKKHFKKRKYDLIIFIDYPDFNLHMSRYAKRAGIKVLYYVSPHIWFWRYYRIKKIKKYVDHVAVLFPFEEKLYQKEKMPATWVGHPIADTASPTLSRQDVYDQFNLSPAYPIITLLPGSREHEIKCMLPTMVAASQLIREKLPNAQFVLPLSPHLLIDTVAPSLPSHISVVQNNTHNILSITQFALVKSGTITLEIALHQIPCVIVYKGSPFTYWIARQLIKRPYIGLPFIGLPNIILGKAIVPELIQEAVTAEAMAEHICRLWAEPEYKEAQISQLKLVKDQLGKNASMKTAELVLNMLAVCGQQQ